VQNLAIFGSTGSVGTSTLDVVARHPDLFNVYALSASTSVDTLLEQCIAHQPKIAIMASSHSAQELTGKLAKLGQSHIQVQAGESALLDLASNQEVDSVMSAIVGAAGLLPTLEAVRAAKRVLIANKEPLVMTGDLFMREAGKSGATILPIDSEHNAIFQCLPDGRFSCGVRRVQLTASGGPFRGRIWSELSNITPDQACAHPNWSMGRKISVDSATMMNKGLELIEAAALFSIPASEVEIIIHPQSIIHSLVEYQDGSFLAQLGAPDMRIPIAHALSWPDRISSGAATLSLTDIARLDFQKPDMANLPCLRLARRAAEEGGTAPAVLNAANEVAVDSFLAEKISFTAIPTIIEKVMDSMPAIGLVSVEAVLQIDNEARERAVAVIESPHHKRHKRTKII
jgi:1-deoxy-D-xylulose-5-phosphate reductoisomerase